MRPERVLVLGCGSVAQCTLPLLTRDLKIDPQHITIVDMLAPVWPTRLPTE
jgi:homospermidine synthase